MIPIPINCHKNENSDLRSISRALQDHFILDNWQNDLTADSIIERVSRCRVVVTGNYQAAVFALAQGIPIVAVAATAYYRNKFQGLANQFQGGFRIVFLEDVFAKGKLSFHLECAW